MKRGIITTAEYQAPCGRLILGAYGGKLCMCDWLTAKHNDRVIRRLSSTLMADVEAGTDEVLNAAVMQLNEYFMGVRHTFDIPTKFVGTPFQIAVWTALFGIPYGTAVSYGYLADKLGCPKAVRAVANANGANALSIFVPCHRVIGSDNSLTGYGGGLEAKKYLLQLEGCI